uniref:Uncharacterized protein n=1 Tax=Lepeophtheirus salmonis TaxID=72036 RepID=A0A0K2UBH2_LEPSM
MADTLKIILESHVKLVTLRMDPLYIFVYVFYLVLYHSILIWNSPVKSFRLSVLEYFQCYAVGTKEAFRSASEVWTKDDSI